MDNDPKFTILVADRNPNVRDLLKRELMSLSCRVLQAKDSCEVLKQAFSQTPLDLLILDPDLADFEDNDVFTKLNNRVPRLSMVIHSIQTDYEKSARPLLNAIFVEKQGNSVEQLKKVVSKILMENYEKRFH